MTYEEYLALVVARLNFHPAWRVGQTYFNVLCDAHPALAERVRGTLADPFYQDKRLPDFFDFILERW